MASMSCSDALYRHLRDLSLACRVWLAGDQKYVILGGVNLPPGYNRSQIDILVEIPRDYPLSPPGVGEHNVFVPPSIRFQGRTPKYLHEGTHPSYSTPGFGPWAWWCYQRIDWDPLRDNLIKFLEMVRADLTDPPTE
jgi:hypothetical protein